MQRDAMHAMADFGIGIGQLVLRLQPAIDRFPRYAAVIGAECPARRDRDVDALLVRRIKQDGMHAHAARARLPELALGIAQSGKLLPRFAAIRRFENRRVLRTRVSRVGIGGRRLDVPDAFELPRMRRAVIPEMFTHLALVNELVAFALEHHAIWAFQLLGTAAGRVPGFAAIIRALNDLPEPTARLRCVNAIRINGRAFEMIHLPAREVRAGDFPILPRAIRRADERAFLCADQDSDFAHGNSCEGFWFIQIQQVRRIHALITTLRE